MRRQGDIFLCPGPDMHHDESAYIIDSLSDLAELRNRVNNGTESKGSYYKLSLPSKQISLVNYSSWEPIRTDRNPFTGNFNGNTHTILIKTDRFGDDPVYGGKNASLFGTIKTTDDYAIKDLKVSGTITRSHLAGGIALKLLSGSIEWCSFTGTVTLPAFEAENDSIASSGGIVGYVYGGSVMNCRLEEAEFYSGGMFSGTIESNIYSGASYCIGYDA